MRRKTSLKFVAKWQKTEKTKLDLTTFDDSDDRLDGWLVCLLTTTTVDVRSVSKLRWNWPSRWSTPKIILNGNVNWTWLKSCCCCCYCCGSLELAGWQGENRFGVTRTITTIKGIHSILQRRPVWPNNYDFACSPQLRWATNQGGGGHMPSDWLTIIGYDVNKINEKITIG